MITFIQSHGGLVPAVLLLVTLLNTVLSALSSILDQLKIKQPGPLGQVAGVLKKIIDVLSANVEHK